jgi:hypothetical protein
VPPGRGHQFYTGINREQDLPLIPRISDGLDLQAIGATFLEETRRRLSEADFDFRTSDLGMDEITPFRRSRRETQIIRTTR